MREAGAHFVLGVDPTVLYVMQFLAVAELMQRLGRTNDELLARHANLL